MKRLPTTKVDLSPQYNTDTIVWKYFDFASFVSFLLNETLIFRRFDKFEDKLEGTLPLKAQKQMYQHFASKSYSSTETNERTEYERQNIQIHKLYTYANCWSISNDENYALWKIYLKGEPNGIALKSSVAHLNDSICPFSEDEMPPKTVLIKDVSYDSFDYNETRQDKVFTHKNPEYRYESELRLLIKDQRNFELRGIQRKEDAISIGFNDNEIIPVSVNSNALISAILISPFAHSWFEEVTNKLIETIKPSLLCKVMKSKVVVQ
jgi:hypothetical protein